MNFLASLDPSMFLYILQSISEGLAALGNTYMLHKMIEWGKLGFVPKSLDTMVCAGCCATLDHIVTYLFKQWTLKSKSLTIVTYLYTVLLIRDEYYMLLI